MIHDKIDGFKGFLDRVGEGRLLCLDVGKVNIGVAVSDESRTIATPKATIKCKNREKDFEQIYNLIKENKVVGLVVGLPLSMSGNETNFSEYVHKFTIALDKYISDKRRDGSLNNEFGIIYSDERLTSQTAENMLIEKFDLSRQKRKQIIDKVAAGYILDGFLSAIKRL